MAATASRKFTRESFVRIFNLLPRQYSSNTETFANVRPQSINHASGMKEKLTFVTEDRGLHIQKGLEHLLSLKDVKINRNHVRQININDRYISKGNDEASLFLYDKIPSLKYNNPDVPIICTRDLNRPWEVKVVLESGDEVVIPTEEKTANEIFINLCEVICGSPSVTNLET